MVFPECTFFIIFRLSYAIPKTTTVDSTTGSQSSPRRPEFHRSTANDPTTGNPKTIRSQLRLHLGQGAGALSDCRQPILCWLLRSDKLPHHDAKGAYSHQHGGPGIGLYDPQTRRSIGIQILRYQNTPRNACS